MPVLIGSTFQEGNVLPQSAITAWSLAQWAQLIYPGNVSLQNAITNAYAVGTSWQMRNPADASKLLHSDFQFACTTSYDSDMISGLGIPNMAALPSYTPEELALLPHDSRGPALVATSWSLTAFASLFLSLRMYCKIVSREASAQVTLVIDAAVATHMVVDYTYGRHTWDFHPPDLDKFVLIVAIRATFTVTAIAWTKTAFAFTLLRLTEGWIKISLWVMIITMNVALGITALFFWIPCTPVQKSWTPSMQEGSCWNPTTMKHYNIFSGALSAAIDFILALLPWKLLLGLQMQKTEKFGAAIALSMGLIAGIVAVVKTVNLPKLDSSDMYDAVDLVIWDITEPALSIVGACIPVLRVLVRDVRSTARRYYMAEDVSRLANPTWQGWKTDGLASKISPASASCIREPDDDSSEKSILQVGTPGATATLVQPGRSIMRTREVTVDSRLQKRGDITNPDNGYELGTISSK
ncbi:hypothetical protein C8A05DRAFT_37252 [Staphylotrichum tortipilum]|uniref:Rhodopsin domain-containing protein n=1 Tax=Staphylotrichum tortipilum TaxID=2831512 RepID=A0AAN6RQE1_9PEZI|nr:hypothetical protein C8A05DRAFT_37252 [Staphylotrichum longicolle]